MTEDERRAELERIRSGPDGVRRIGILYVQSLTETGEFGTPGIMTGGMIEHILAREFPEARD